MQEPVKTSENKVKASAKKRRYVNDENAPIQNQPQTSDVKERRNQRYPISTLLKSRPYKTAKIGKSSYESPCKSKSKAKATRIITLEENYSQTKRFQKGTLVCSNTKDSDNQIRPTPNKSETSLGSTQKKPGKKQVVERVFQQTKPTSVKVEQ